MDIGKITLDRDEMKQAVKEYLKRRGINVDVAEISVGYGGKARAWEVTSVAEQDYVEKITRPSATATEVTDA